MLHFTNGSIVVRLLERAGLPGRVVECADPLHEGPVAHGLSLTAWREVRARFLAGGFDLPLDATRADLARRDAAIEAAAAEDEVVLWFEHDLFDQLNLLWLLDALDGAGVGPGQVRLVVIGAHPEVPEFDGLGQLSPAQLAALFPARVALTPAALDEAHAAWAEICAPDPRASAARAAAPSVHWPWLPGALGRLWEELPATGSGLSRTERQGLDAIASGATTLGEAFAGCRAREPRRFLGDWSFYRAMRGLAAARTPLLSIGPPAGPASQVSLTAAGMGTLAGTLDHASLNGVDRWVGGVQLLGHAPAWRWDGAGIVAG